MNNRQKGFALLLVLLTMGFLALLGTQLVAAARTDTRLADNLKQAAVLEARDVGPVTLVGGSMGGVVAQHLVLRHPARVRREEPPTARRGSDRSRPSPGWSSRCCPTGRPRTCPGSR